MSFREKAEQGFDTFSQLITNKPWHAIALMLLLTCSLAAGAQFLKLDTSPTSYVAMHDPARITYNKFRTYFENDDVYLIVVRSPDIYSPKFLKRLYAYHQDLAEQIPYLDDVISLVNARVVRGDDDSLIVDELLDPFPVSAEDFALVKTRLRDNPAFVNSLVSEDESAVAIVVNIIPGADGEAQTLDNVLSITEQPEEENSTNFPPAVGVSQQQLTDTMAVMHELQKKYQTEDFDIYLTGDLQMTYGLMQIVAGESRKFVGITMAVIAVVLLLLFRRISGVMLPMLVVILPIAATIGMMGWTGLPMTLSTGSLPTFLFAVCVGDAVHILSVFYQRLRSGDEKKQAIRYAVRHSGLAVLMTSITTAGALSTFSLSELMPIAGLGIAAPIGVMLAFVYSVVLLPALLTVLPIRECKNELAQGTDNSLLTRLLLRIGNFCCTRPWLVVSVWCLLVVLSIYGSLNIRLSHEPIKWFPEDAPTRVAAETANRDLKGAMPLELIIDSGKENGLMEPEAMQRIDKLVQFIKQLHTEHIRSGQTTSVIDIVKESNKALHNNDPAFYRIPDSRELISQEMLLFESSGSEDLERVVDSQFRYARLHVSLPFENGLHYVPFVEKVEQGAKEILGEELTLESSGLILLYMRSFNLMLNTMVNSYTLAILMLIPFMVLLIGEFRLGLISLIPNLAPIAVGLGCMYLAGVPFDMFTMTIGTIAIGVAVDDTIHFMHSFRRYYRGGDSAPEAVRKTLYYTGKALLITSIALCVGFFVQMSGDMISVQNTGMITGLTIVAALLADLTLSPALVILAARFAEADRNNI